MRPMFFSRALAALLVLALPAAAKLVPIPNEGAGIVIPDDWKIEQHPGFAFVAETPDETSSVIVRVIPNRGETKAGESFYLEAMKQARQKLAQRSNSSLIIIEAGTAAINGVPASYIHTEMPLPDNRTIYSRDFLVAANGKFYALSGDTPDPYLDAKMNDILGTFHFDSPPVLPDLERPYYRRLQQVTAAVAVVMALAILAFWWILHRRRAARR